MHTKLIVATLAIVVAFAGAASAQTGAAGTTGTAAATNAVTVNAYTGMGNGTTGDTGSGSAPTTANVRYSGHEWTTPSVQGSYFAGANPCLIGIGGSAAGGPIGLSFTFGRSDEGCQRRSDAAAWHALGHDDVAVARMCQDDDNRTAFEAIGFLCPQSRPKGAQVAMLAPPSAPSAGGPAPQPMNYAPVLPNPAIAAQPTPGMVATRLPQATDRPDWCGVVTGPKERASYKQACGF